MNNGEHLAMQAEFLKKVEPLVDSYQERIDIVGEAVKGANNPRLQFSDFDKATLAVLLDNVDKALNRYQNMKSLSDRTYSETVGPFKKHAYNIISALYTTMDVRDLISFQPLSQKLGALYYLTYQYGSDKGAIRKGDTVFSPKEPGKRSAYYSTQWVKQEVVAFTFDTTDSVATLEYFPVTDPQVLSLVVTAGAAAGTYTYLSATGTVINLQKDGSASTDATVESTTGVVILTGVDIGVGTSAIDYRWNSEKFSTDVPIPRMTIAVEEQIVQTERRQLLVDIMLDVSYDFESQFARSLSADMENAVIQHLQNEFAFRVLEEIYAGADGNNGKDFFFYRTPAAGITKSDHSESLFELLGNMSTEIRDNLGAGWGNKLVIGSDLLNYLKILDTETFKRVPKPRGNGPYYAGTLNDEYDVYYNPELPKDEFFMLYKGSDWWEAPYYVGSYLPLMSSDYMMFPDMHAEQGYISMEAYEYLFPKLVVKGQTFPGADPG